MDKIVTQAKLQETIANTKKQLKEAKADRKHLNKKWRELRELNANPPSDIKEKGVIRRRFKRTTARFTLATKEVTALEKALESQLEQLGKLVGAEEDINLSDVSDSDSES